MQRLSGVSAPGRKNLKNKKRRKPKEKSFDSRRCTLLLVMKFCCVGSPLMLLPLRQAGVHARSLQYLLQKLPPDPSHHRFSRLTQTGRRVSTFAAFCKALYTTPTQLLISRTTLPTKIAGDAISMVCSAFSAPVSGNCEAAYFRLDYHAPHIGPDCGTLAQFSADGGSPELHWST